MQKLPGVFCLLLLSAFLAIATSTSNIVTTRLGYSGDLPFTLETGEYIGVGENETAQLFYYFVESQRNSALDPVLIWRPPGLGCSGFEALETGFEAGPLTFKLGDYNGSLPTLHDNPWAWTQGINIIYLDAPVGAGFSYSKSYDGYIMDDYKYVAQVYEFLQKWLSEHPQFLKNQLYIGGESYGGMPVPMIAQQIVIGNEAGSVPMINLKGYVIGGAVTDSFTDTNAKIPYAHRLTLISDQLYESAKTSCNGNYVNVDSDNYQCSSDLDAIDKVSKNRQE
ncbi:serine carboxypeptidase-like 18 [Corylus avellana]|uniref:serine carboxypeptidase-like 18 n=1 Tax=Corylus avellana TaxID=13451 RepID=UPI00286AA95C|nr:serine carboxypeptidase-like 18 [Corylus avellana]